MPGWTAPPRWKYTLGLLLKVGSKVVYKLVSSGRINKPKFERVEIKIKQIGNLLSLNHKQKRKVREIRRFWKKTDIL